MRLLEEENPLPTLCGYFAKVFMHFASRHKHDFLKYLFIAREGRVFDSLLRHVENHSLALVIVQLVNLQVGPGFVISDEP